ncbi:unnamed protein product [Protopolystoma xenopodis]|uniref:Aldehyde dehydrogenase domain-containing protein n=1 Tax=Protopolystoma xenopodis TaxID=117903 RepID=A0A448XSK1_9PLAT|nr:unnamed protein product [Protopolystoma xenopodis]
MFPVSLVCGNTMLLKPSERDPGAALRLVELANEAGVPPGVLNVVHGSQDVVKAICEHPDIRAISFVGSDQAGKFIYRHGCAHGKRVQCNMVSRLPLRWSSSMLKQKGYALFVFIDFEINPNLLSSW